MRTAVVGTGVMGALHARVYSEISELCAVYDKNLVCAQRVADRYGAKPCSSLSELIAEKPDAISVAVPTEYHLEVALTCMSQGVSILVEKPIAPSIADATLLVESAKVNKVILGVGYIEYYNPVFHVLKSAIESKDYGNLVTLVFRRVGGVPRSANNVVLDLMTHDISLMFSLFKSKPCSICSNMHKSGNTVDSAQALFRFKEVSVVCEANWVSPVKFRSIFVTGTEGCCEANLITQQITAYSVCSDEITTGNSFDQYVSRYGIPVTRTIATIPQEPLRGELLAFLHAVQTGDTSEIISGERAIDILSVTLDTMKGTK